VQRVTPLDCQQCRLAQTRRNVVPGVGTGQSGLLIVGLGPGYSEDLVGAPFVGPAGRLLDRILASLSLEREDVYITNLVKCKPENNRPRPDEIEACSTWLAEELEELAGKATVAILLGQFAAGIAFPGLTMHAANGLFTMKGDLVWTATYHPAAVLRGQPALYPEILRTFARATALATSTSSEN